MNKILFVILSLVGSFASATTICQKAIDGKGPVYHRNGRLMTATAGKVGATWYHANGKVMTPGAMQVKSPVYYPNGFILSFYTGLPGGTWYHPNGKVLSFSAGEKGANYFDSRGRRTLPQSMNLNARQLWQIACYRALNSL